MKKVLKKLTNFFLGVVSLVFFIGQAKTSLRFFKDFVKIICLGILDLHAQAKLLMHYDETEAFEEAIFVQETQKNIFTNNRDIEEYTKATELGQFATIFYFLISPLLLLFPINHFFSKLKK